MRLSVVLIGVLVGVGFTPLRAQDPAKVDAAHYTVMSENNEVRILHIHYGPHEKSTMHRHPDSVVVFLTNGNTKFTFPDGHTEDMEAKAGEARFTPATVHLPENVGDQPMDAVLIELKNPR